MNEQKPKREDEIFEPSRFCHIGVVVKNIDETIRYYEKEFGFGPFEIRYVEFSNATYYGEIAGYRGKRAYFHVGPVEIELIELIDGKTIHQDFLEEKGDGIHHIAFYVDDVGKSKKNADKAGFKITQSAAHPDGGGFAYLDTDKTGGVIIEMVQRRV